MPSITLERKGNGTCDECADYVLKGVHRIKFDNFGLIDLCDTHLLAVYDVIRSYIIANNLSPNE